MIDFQRLNLALPTLDVLRALGLACKTRTTEHWRGQCPFHESTSGRSRSLEVSIPLRKWHCHSRACGQYGDLLDLWAGVRRVSLLTAARELAREFGIYAERR